MTKETTMQEQEKEKKSVEAASSDALVSSAPESSEKSETGTVKKKSSKRKKRHVPLGKIFVTATYNNTIISFADMQGNVLSQSSAGRCGFKGPKKSTPYAAGIIVKAAAEKVVDFGLKDVHVSVKGVGSGRDGALRAINANGFNILSITDTTPVPHNGCRPKKPRRV